MTSTSEPAAQCTAGANGKCSFPNMAAQEHDGRYYCPVHAPMAASNKLTTDQFVELLRTSSGATHIEDWTNSVFPPLQRGQYLFQGNVDLSGSTFAGGVAVGIQGRATFDRSTFHGTANLISHASQPFFVRECRFKGDVSLDLSETKEIDCSGCHFDAAVRVNTNNAGYRLLFRDCSFAKVPRFSVSGSTKISQSVDFTGARFLATAFGPADEGMFREIRNAFHTNRDREHEGMFYALEKRAHRLNLPLPSRWMARSLSAVYDWTSAYGQSFERALVAFVLVQILFAAIYSGIAGGFGGTFDECVARFTLAQVVKPFEVLSLRQSGASVCGSQLDGFAVAVLALVHSVLSLATVALFLLAVRWRFRRE